MNFADVSKKCKDNKLFINLKETDREHLFKISKTKKYAPGEVVFYSSEKGNDFYIVDKGKLELNLNSGKEKSYSRGDLFGEISVMNNSPRMGTMTAITDCSLIEFNGDLLWSENLLPSEVQLSIFRELVDYVVSYLDSEYSFATEKVVKKGEGITIEFKASTSKLLKKKIIETMCAFMNTRGGTILVGVKDDATVIGLKKTEKELDNYKMSLSQMLRDRVGAVFTSYIHYNIEKYNNKKLLRINCIPSKQPAIFENGKDHIFFMRSGPSNIKAPNIKELLNYYNKRFN